VGRMAAQITHEVRNPLASIGLYAELLADEISERGDEPRRLVSSIISEVDRLTEITETYLRFTRLPQAKLEREDLGAVVTAALEFSRAELAQAGITLAMEVTPGLPEVAADEAQIRQALLNLVRNAREAMPRGGTLRVVVDAPTPDQVRICVSDTGPGIASEDLGKIFDPFFSTKTKGTGLGLALVQQVVVDHAGRIDVQSPAGEGTRFSLIFPALRPAGSDGDAMIDSAAS
jgi:signal transduction histidine kinase